MANQRHKHPSLLRDQRASRTELQRLAAPELEEIPAPPPGLLKASQTRWANFWKSPAAARVHVEQHGGALADWIRHVDEWERLYKLFRKSMLVRGSEGQLRLNPLANRLTALRAEIARYELAFGLTPLATLRLGFDPLPRSVSEALAIEEEPDPYDGPDPREILRAVK